MKLGILQLGKANRYWIMDAGFWIKDFGLFCYWNNF